jgi:hypothetical protein
MLVYVTAKSMGFSSGIRIDESEIFAYQID